MAILAVLFRTLIHQVALPVVSHIADAGCSLHSVLLHSVLLRVNILTMQFWCLTTPDLLRLGYFPVESHYSMCSTRLDVHAKAGSTCALLSCRYHYNVGSTRLDVHVKKGLADGLYISSVGCASDLWGIIMDAGTGFNSQLYRVVPDAFLPKEWIMEKWDQGFYITAVAGIACLQCSQAALVPKGSFIVQCLNL